MGNKIRSKDRTPYDFQDGIKVSGADLRVASIADLKALDITKFNTNKLITVDVLGYYAPGDGGGGVFFWDVVSTETDNLGIIIQPNTLPTAGRWRRKYSDNINIKWFGAKGDDPTFDNYEAINTAVTIITANGGGKLVFPEGRTYNVNRHRIDGGGAANGIMNFGFYNCNGLVIDGCGSKIIMHGGWTRTADTTIGGFTYSYQNCIGFEFISCNNVAIRNLEIDGGAATITKAATAEGWSHGIVVSGCHHVHLENVYVHHYCADGLYIERSGPITAFKVSRYFSANNCKFTNNARQGCSIIQLRWAKFTNCEFSYTGQTGTYGGHSPQAGVDIEPNYVHDNPQSPLFIAGDESTGDITFIGCGFVDNSGFEFVASNRDTVQHPVQFFGCTFKNTNNSNPQVVTATRMARFYACNFDNVAWFPGYTFNDDNATEFYNCSLKWSRNAYGILQASPNPTLRIQGCDIKFTGTSPHGGSIYLIYIQAEKTYFRDNNVFYSSTLHNGTTYDVVSLIQGVSESRGNRFSTDLTASGKFFTLSFDNASYVDDVIVNRGKFSPTTAAYSLNNIVIGNKSFSTLVSSTGNKVYYGSSAPASGTWARGDRVLNTNPSAGGVVEWVCTTGGAPGTWVPTYVNANNTGGSVQEVVTPSINGAKTNVTISFRGDANSGSCLLEVDIAGSGGGTRIVLTRYGSAAAVVLQNTGGNALTYTTTGFDGGISVNIAINITHPVVRAKAVVGGLSSVFSTNLSITTS